MIKLKYCNPMILETSFLNSLRRAIGSPCGRFRTGIGWDGRTPDGELKMAIPVRQVAVVLYVVAMAAVIVGVDFVFFRNRFWERLTVNIGIVLVFLSFYFRFLRRP
jgi:hypothetical protein